MVALLAASCSLVSLDDLRGPADGGGAGDAASDGAPFNPGSCGEAGSGLYGYWTFDEDAGPARDCVGGFDGVMVGAVGRQAGCHAGGCVSVGLPDAGYRFVKMGAGVPPGLTYTVSAWVKLPSGSAQAIIASKGTNAYAGSEGWELDVLNGTLTYVVGLGGGVQARVAAQIVPVDTWTHVAASSDGKVLRACKNGVCVEKTLDGGMPTLAPELEFRVGTGYRDQGTPVTVDELRVFDRALSVAEIQALAAR